MKVGILGGSFNPIHNAHLKLASAARRQLGLQRVYFVLSPKSPFKLNSKQPSAKIRWLMLKLALRDLPWAKAADWELRRRGPSYTVTTLASYRKKHPTDKVHFIMGSDSVKNFRHWKSPRQILALSTMVIGRRPGFSTIALPGFKDIHPIVLRGIFPDLSSTKIRHAVTNGRFVSAIPKPVAEFIRRKKIYQ